MAVRGHLGPLMGAQKGSNRPADIDPARFLIGVYLPRALKTVLEPIWDRTWGHLGRFLGPLGAIFGPSWSLSRAMLGLSPDITRSLKAKSKSPMRPAPKSGHLKPYAYYVQSSVLNHVPCASYPRACSLQCGLAECAQRLNKVPRYFTFLASCFHF